MHIAPNGTATFIHRSWFTKYDPKGDETRSFSHVSVELSGGLSQANTGFTLQGLGSISFCLAMCLA
jgi:hypothetical protein